jgi:hypothetical protein
MPNQHPILLALDHAYEQRSALSLPELADVLEVPVYLVRDGAREVRAQRVGNSFGPSRDDAERIAVAIGLFDEDAFDDDEIDDDDNNDEIDDSEEE